MPICYACGEQRWSFLVLWACVYIRTVRCTFYACILTYILILFAWTVNIVLKYPLTIEDIINSNSKERFRQYLLLSSNENRIRGPQRNVCFPPSLITVGLIALHKEKSGTGYRKNWNPQNLPADSFILPVRNVIAMVFTAHLFFFFSFYVYTRTVERVSGGITVF